MHLSRCDGWLLQRQIPGTRYTDAMGCHPLFLCQDWSQLEADLNSISTKIVSLILVTDPFGQYDRQLLSKCFDNVIHFKYHYVVDLSRPLEQNVKKSHRATARRALRKLDVQVCEQPHNYLEEWDKLFRHMIRRHKMTGMHALSKRAFAEQFRTPGAIMFAAIADGNIVGLDILYVQNDVAYGHACAFNELGYKLRASYAMRWYMLNYFSGKLRWVDFGGAAGLGDNESDGLISYKRGWCADKKPVYLCRKVFQQCVYDRLVKDSHAEHSRYFPAYREGEFA